MRCAALASSGGRFLIYCEGRLDPLGAVHFNYVDGEIRILAGRIAVKTRNVIRSGQATLCVEVTEGGVRSFVTVSGPVEVRQPPPMDDLLALDERYSRDDFADGWDEDSLAAAVLLIIRPDRRIAWTDWD